jgi:curved DNA-binding protein CbpA
MEAINRRYKRLIMVWHPDRFQNVEGKADAEEEFKKINVM